MAVAQHSFGTRMLQCRSLPRFPETQTPGISFRGLDSFRTNARGIPSVASLLSGMSKKKRSMVARSWLKEFPDDAQKERHSFPPEGLVNFVSRAGFRQRKAEESVEAGNLAERDMDSSVRTEAPVLSPIERYTFFAFLVLGAGILHSVLNGDAEAAVNHLTSTSRPVGVDMRDLALGPEGPLVEEFWENVSRYVLYFFTVVTGGIYALLKPVIDSLKNPIAAVLITIIISGSLYLIVLTVRAMLGIGGFEYDYAV